MARADVTFQFEIINLELISFLKAIISVISRCCTICERSFIVTRIFLDVALHLLVPRAYCFNSAFYTLQLCVLFSYIKYVNLHWRIKDIDNYIFSKCIKQFINTYTL